MKKILLLIIFIFSINQTNAWLGLTAQNGDLLNISKWNELIDKINLKIDKTNLEAGNNIELTQSGADIIISSSFSGSGIETPYIKSTQVTYFQYNENKTITLSGANFIPTSVVTIPGFDGTINSYNIISESEISLDITSGDSTGDFDIVINNNGKLNTIWSGNGIGLIYVTNNKYISGDDTTGRKWSDGTFAKTCNDYKNPVSPYEYIGDTGDGIYIIKPDSSQSEFSVYCDMTTDNGGWTRFVYIKGNYTITEGKNCWLGTNINSTELECFNPNRYNISVNTLMNIDWSGNYTYTIIDPNPSTTTESNNGGSRYCLGHDEYMTIMRTDQTPQADGSDLAYVRLGKSYCKYSREVGGRGSQFMNYDNNGNFGQSSGANRESSANNASLYFR